MNRKIKNIALCIMNCALCIGFLVSCQKSDLAEVETEGTQHVTLNIVANDAVGTRADAIGIAQYIMEVYSDATYTTPANIFGEGENKTNQATSTNGSFSMILDRTVNYYCLFWADKDVVVAVDKAYTTTTLKAVTLKESKTPAEAWFGTGIINGKNATQTITLKRAVAKLNLKEIGKIIANTTLTATFVQPTVFNVSNGDIVRGTSDVNLKSRTETITLTEAISGTKDTPVILNSINFFILTPAATQYIAKVTFKCDITAKTTKESEFEIDNVPFQANYTTNIIGHYTNLTSETFSVTCDDSWATPDNDKNFGVISYAVGDLYPNAVSPAGIVAYVDPAHDSYNAITKKGTKFLLMSFEQMLSSGNNIGKLSLPTTGGLTWYVPSINEWLMVYGAMSGLNVTLQSDKPYIDGQLWDELAEMPHFSSTATQRDEFNTKIADAGGIKLEYIGDYDSRYWSSTIDGAYRFYINLSSSEYAIADSDSYNVRFFSKVNYQRYTVGDFYPNPTDMATAIGVVFYVDPADATKGIIVSLDETTAPWSTLKENTFAQNDFNGIENMETIKNYFTLSNYPAFAWCDAKNTANISGLNWHLPVAGTLEALNLKKDIINVALAAASATQISDSAYWTSRESDNFSAHVFSFADYTQSIQMKSANYKIRAISFF